MGCYRIGDHIPGRDDTDNIFHPRFVGEGIPAANTFHAVIYDKLAKRTPNSEVWCTEDAWFAHSPQHDFRVKDPQGYICGLPLIVPTCPKKLFVLGPRKKYVDIVTDTLHASSSDLITWNILVMMRLDWISCIPGEWIEITLQSLEERKVRDRKPPFLPDNRRVYARVTPVALSRAGIPGLAVHTLDQYPMDGLGMYKDLETSEQYSGHPRGSSDLKFKRGPIFLESLLKTGFPANSPLKMVIAKPTAVVHTISVGLASCRTGAGWLLAGFVR